MATANILIVEDELVTRNTLKSVFEAEGYQVFEANDGNEMNDVISNNMSKFVDSPLNAAPLFLSSSTTCP